MPSKNVWLPTLSGPRTGSAGIHAHAENAGDPRADAAESLFAEVSAQPRACGNGFSVALLRRLAFVPGYLWAIAIGVILGALTGALAATSTALSLIGNAFTADSILAEAEMAGMLHAVRMGIADIGSLCAGA